MPETDNTIDEGKIWAFFAYWGILFLLPLLGKKDNKFAVFHGKQGMVMCIAVVVIAIVMTILGFIPYIGPILYILLLLVLIVLGVFAIIGMINALTGKYWKMPILGDIAEKINI
ncbi:DUF4870 domain-containing protein [candidate division WOR-3 bacterium]|nr:DUF4870 domain-containing protein [candidate division WOR-3 bacterium]